MGSSHGDVPLRLSCQPASVPEVTSDDTPSEVDDTVEAADAALRDSRARLAEVPAEVVVTNHVVGLYELAAIHLSATPPRLADAALAIDAMGCLVEGLGERLGAEYVTMNEALSNIRIAFVQIKNVQGG